MSVQCILEGQQDSTKFDKAGGTITGDVIIEDGNKICNSDKSASIQLNGDNTDESVILSVDNNYAIILTGTETIIKNVVAPTEEGDAVNKQYVDQYVGGGVPTNHASTDKTYGAGSETKWGHVRLTDQFDDSGTKAADGYAASPWAVYQVYDYANSINENKAPTNHASADTTYGKGTSTNYGHVKLSSSTSSTDGVADGVAATPNAVKEAYNHADSKAPKSHASTATTYGTGSSTNYGHVKLSASTNSSSGTSSGVAATPSAVKSAYDLANKAVTTLLGGKKIVCGWADIKYKNTSQQDTPVDFKTTFNAAPVVIIGQPFNGVVCTVFEGSVTTTGFTVNVPAVGSSTLSTRKMAWIAIGT